MLGSGLGAYGYPANITASDDVVREIVSGASDGNLRLRRGVPADAIAQGGLTIYGAECGRFPLGLTVLLEW